MKLTKIVKSIKSKEIIKKEPKATIKLETGYRSAFYKQSMDNERKNLLSWK